MNNLHAHATLGTQDTPPPKKKKLTLKKYTAQKTKKENKTDPRKKTEVHGNTII